MNINYYSSAITQNQGLPISFPANQDKWVSFSSEVSGSTSPVKAALEITVQTGYGASNLEYFTLNGYVYTAKANPEWAEFVTGTTTAHVAQSIYWMLYNDERINYKYNIQYDISIPNKIYLFAVIAGPAYNFTWTTNAQYISATASNSVTNRRDQDKANWGMWLELWTKNNTYQTQNFFDSNFNKQLLYNKDYQSDNQYTFNLAPAISKVLWTDAPSQQFTIVNNWFTNVNYRFGEAYSTNSTTLWKQKYITGDVYNCWAYNVSRDTFNINDYISYDSPFVAVVTLNLGLVNGNTLDISGPLTTTFTMSTTPVNSVGLSLEADNLVALINGLTTDYLATKPTSNSNSVIITAQNVGGAYDLFFNPNSQWWGVQATSGVDASPCQLLNGIDDLEVQLDSKQLAYFFFDKRVNTYFAIKKTYTFRDGSAISHTDDFHLAISDGLYQIPFGVNDGDQWRPMFVDWKIVYKTSSSGTVNDYTVSKRLWIIENAENEGENKLNLAFQNSFGTFDSIQFVGQYDKVYERDMSSFNKFRSFDWTPKQGELQTAIGDSRAITTWRSGWMRSDSFLQISELSKSKRNYNLDNDLLVYIDAVDWQWNNEGTYFNCSIIVKDSIAEKMID